jgi:hypothetical protein
MYDLSPFSQHWEKGPGDEGRSLSTTLTAAGFAAICGQMEQKEI